MPDQPLAQVAYAPASSLHSRLTTSASAANVSGTVAAAVTAGTAPGVTATDLSTTTVFVTAAEALSEAS